MSEKSIKTDPSSDAASLDRLSGLMAHFALSFRPVQQGAGNLVIHGDPAARRPERAVYRPSGAIECQGASDVLLLAEVNFGGDANPLLAALPWQIEIDARTDPESMAVLTLLVAEADSRRCGVGSVLSRLGEVLIIRLLRQQISAGVTNAGLLAGLADPHLSRAIVAIHNAPGRAWKNEDLARVSGLSRSRFSEVFHTRLGETPQSYLRRWRMCLARQDIAHGDRIQTIARRYGYASSEAFARAFHRETGMAPLTLRRQARQPSGRVAPEHDGKDDGAATAHQYT